MRWLSLVFCGLLITSTFSADASPRRDALRTVNAWRAAEGCAPLQVSRYAERHAARHSRWMAEHDSLTHSTDLDLRLGDALAGEVIGVGGTVSRIVSALYVSPEHYDLLTDCRYDIGGFGIARDSRVWLTGRVYAR